MGAYRLRVPASRVGYVPEAQGGLPPGSRVHGRTVRTAHRATPGRDVPPAEDGVGWWGLLDEEGWSVRAAPLAHTAPCVGFVVEEAGKPGRLVPEVALPP